MERIEWTTIGKEHFGTVDDRLTYRITAHHELLLYGGDQVIKTGPPEDLKAFAALLLADSEARKETRS